VPVPPRLIPAIVTIAVVLACGVLSNWQFQRDIQRNGGLGVARETDAKPPLTLLPSGGDGAWRRVALSGAFAPPAHLLAGLELPDGIGYGVEQVLETPSGRVMVQRAVLPLEGLGAALPAVTTTGPAAVTGRLRPLPDTAGEPYPNPREGLTVWPIAGRRTLARQLGARDDVYLILGDDPIVYDPTSRAYAYQWAGMGVVALVMGLYASGRAKK